MMEELIEYLVENTADKGSFTIEYNNHKGYYITLKSHLVNHPDLYDFPNEEEKAHCINTNTIINVHWYVDTPVGFVNPAASNIRILKEYIMEEDNANKQS